MIQALVLSVPNTGTRFVKDMLKRAGLACNNEHFWGSDKSFNRFRDYTDTPIIIPERDFDAVAASWDRRGRPHEAQHFSLQRAWDEMHRFYECATGTVLPFHIDDPELREVELAAICEAFGVQFKVDFNDKIGHGTP